MIEPAQRGSCMVSRSTPTMKMRVREPPASMMLPLPLMVTELKIGDSGPARWMIVLGSGNSISIVWLDEFVALTCAIAQLSVPTVVAPLDDVPGSLATLTTQTSLAMENSPTHRTQSRADRVWSAGWP